MADQWNQLADRIKYLRELYAGKKIKLKPDEGITVALDAAALAAKGASVSDEELTKLVPECHVVWALYDSVKDCVDAGLDVTNHLAQLTTGSLDFGVPAASGSKTIFFKDFELELFVAGQLAKRGFPVQFSEKQNDPSGEFLVKDVLFEAKHPNSTGGLDSLMRKFNGQLQKRNSYGVFVTAVEDAFSMADKNVFASEEEFLAWRETKRAQIESFGLSVVLRGASLPRIAALVQTSSAIEAVAGRVRFARYSNSLLFDHREYPADVRTEVERIAAVFNPYPPRFSAVRHSIESPQQG